jgi:hypothetical protein
LQSWKLIRRGTIPRGDKGAYTGKQKRKAEHSEEGYEKKGVSKREAEARAWATVNKSGSGRGKTENRSASKKGGKKGGKKAAKKSSKKSSKKTSKKK